ncbi:MAG: ferric reductase-like transmembrane domain-containing protein [Sphaerochaeta sp.]
MNNKSRLYYLLPGFTLYFAVPIIYMLVGDFPSRTVLKEFLSLVTVGAFFLLLGQFYLSRINIVTLKGQKYSKVVRLHKIIGYIGIPIIFLHPFFIVLPRYFEASLDPSDAFVKILTSFDNRAIILGLIGMLLMILIGITSILRIRIGLKYKTWRAMHAILSAAFIVVATWHAVALGRHMDKFLSTYTILMSSIGMVFLIRTYFFNTENEEKIHE